LPLKLLHGSVSLMIDWHQIKLVLLDMDGTVLDLNFDNQFWQVHLPRAYASRHGLSNDQAIAEIGPRLQQTEGSLNWYCLDHWSRELDLDITALKHELAHLIAFRPQARSFLEALRRRKIPILLVTNAHAESLRLKLYRTRLDQLVNGIVCAHDIGVAKESSRFWQYLVDHYAIGLEHWLLIDDSPGVLRSACHFGIPHLLMVEQPDSQSPKRIQQEFQSLATFTQIMPGAQGG